MDTPIITIPSKLSKGEELVVVRRRDFDIFQNWRQEVKDALAKIGRGRKEYRAQKTISVLSPRIFR